MKTYARVLLPLLLLHALPAAVQGQIVQDGGFETDSLIPNWTLSGPDASDIIIDDGSDTGIEPHSGNYCAVLGPVGSLSFLSQTLTTTPGTSYTLSFWLDSPDGQTPNEFAVYWNGTALSDQTDIGATGWVNYQFSVTAASVNSVLQFGARNDISFFGLDDISVVGVAPPPPLPFTFTTNNGAITITGYTGPADSVTSVIIPDTITGLPVTGIGEQAFYNCASLTDVTIGANVTSIGDEAFLYCFYLTNVTIGANVNSIGEWAFDQCYKLTNVTIPNSVTSIGAWAFYYCIGMTNVLIGANVNSIGNYAFDGCRNLTHVYASGNALSSIGLDVFGDPPTIYYLPGATGWANYAATSGVPVAVWSPQTLTSDGGFGMRNNQFGFNITWASGMVVVVEACTNLSNPTWSAVATNTLTDGSSYFSDPQWTNYPRRFYRLRWL